MPLNQFENPRVSLKATVWTDSRGTTWHPEQMSTAHLINTLRYLYDRREKFLFAYVMDPVWASAPDSVQAEVEHLEPDEWIMSQPLTQALVAELAVRAEIRFPDAVTAWEGGSDREDESDREPESEPPAYVCWWCGAVDSHPASRCVVMEEWCA